VELPRRFRGHLTLWGRDPRRSPRCRANSRPLVDEDWQRQFWWEAQEFDPATGLRIYNEVGLGIPRKNTKLIYVCP
jgi:hypothetical protein